MKRYLLGIILMFTLLLSGCKTTEYIKVPVETVRTEYKVQKDSIYLHDSINVYTETKGDTVYITKLKYKIKETFKTDTVLKRDSIPVIVEVEKVVEVNKLHSWQKILMWIGGVGLLVLLGIGINKFKIWKLLF